MKLTYGLCEFCNGVHPGTGRNEYECRVDHDQQYDQCRKKHQLREQLKPELDDTQPLQRAAQ
jgi:hypothetical protein